jgi:hypothetical protein
VALAPPVALKVAAGVAVALAVASADPGRPPEGRTSIAVSRAEGNRWVVARSSTWRLPWGPVVERTCSRGYSFRQRHWVSLGCRMRPPMLEPPR